MLVELSLFSIYMCQNNKLNLKRIKLLQVFGQHKLNLVLPLL